MKRILIALAFLLTAAQGFAFYNPEQGRWTSRDPIGRAGGLSLYAFIANDASNFYDLLGAEKLPCEFIHCELKQYNAFKILVVVKIWYLYNTIDLGTTTLYCEVGPCCEMDWPDDPTEISNSCVVSWPDGLMKDCTVCESLAATITCPND